MGFVFYLVLVWTWTIAGHFISQIFEIGHFCDKLAVPTLMTGLLTQDRTGQEGSYPWKFFNSGSSILILIVSFTKTFKVRGYIQFFENISCALVAQPRD